MDKEYKLTDRVSKDSIKSPIFKKWVKRILCIACILSLALQLTLCCLPIQASAAENDSIVGTWVFNDTLDLASLYRISCDESNGAYHFFNCSFEVVIDGVSTSFISFRVYQPPTNKSNYYLYYSKNSSSYTTGYVVNSGWKDVELKTINIIVPPTNTGFINWLKANATKQDVDVYDFTGETRIFHDELTLFNTSDASWTETFSFNFEVLGVGTADYLILQRTTQNNYTMSYSFDFEDSGGLTMIYRDSPPFDNGDSEWLGGKVNRKVITFITNPEDPEFQQWLLDNTTLFDNVKYAYQLGQQSGYNNGYEEGFANSLIGDSLSGPINALSQITLIEIQGTAITLGGVVMTAIALCLVLAFLKLYAGG